MKTCLIVLLAFLSIGSSATTPTLLGPERLRIVDVLDNRSQDLTVRSIRILGRAAYEINITNGSDRTLTAAGIVVFLDHTGASLLANGGQEGDIVPIASQAPPGDSAHRHACLAADGTAAPADYSIGSYRCLTHKQTDLAEAHSAVVLLLDVYVDEGDRD